MVVYSSPKLIGVIYIHLSLTHLSTYNTAQTHWQEVLFKKKNYSETNLPATVLPLPTPAPSPIKIYFIIKGLCMYQLTLLSTLLWFSQQIWTCCNASLPCIICFKTTFHVWNLIKFKTIIRLFASALFVLLFCWKVSI